MATHVVVLEDDPLLCQLIGSALRSDGYQVHEVVAPDALDELVEAQSVDVLVTDVFIDGDPVGVQIVGRYLAEERITAAVLMSGHALGSWQDDLPERATFLLKPFSASVLREAVAALLPCETA